MLLGCCFGGFSTKMMDSSTGEQCAVYICRVPLVYGDGCNGDIDITRSACEHALNVCVCGLALNLTESQMLYNSTVISTR